MSGPADVPYARRLWWAIEPYHAVQYFAPEPREALDAAGLRGFWMGYVGGRSAPLGPVPPGVVTALFHNFHPARIERALPDAWAFATPEAVLSARLHGVGQALTRSLGDAASSAELATVAEIARQLAESLDCAGRPLAAANLSLDWPTVPHLVLWQAATILREHRGDGHVAALVAAGLDGVECHVLALAPDHDREHDPERAEGQRAARGWSEADWEAATARLWERGLLDADGALTARGNNLRLVIEEQTDLAASRAFGALTTDAQERLLTVTEELSGLVVAEGDVPFPNPMGLPDPRADLGAVLTGADETPG
ncbi:MAG: hypothetical protein S0880_19045 [Actinomycetota bacterium]|nr:hypothetical protein [Actinomycetota bacterium]